MPRKGQKLSPAAAEKQRQAIHKWQAENTEVLSIRLPKGRRDAWKRLAAAKGTAVATMIQEYMNRLCEEEGIE